MNSGVLERYKDFLPVTKKTPLISLGEGDTPLLASNRIIDEVGCDRLFFKLEGCNPTGSFKDRGIEDLARARSQRAVSQQPASEEKPTSKHAPPPLRKDKLEKGPTMGNGGKGLDIPDILYRKGLARRPERSFAYRHTCISWHHANADSKSRAGPFVSH